MMAAFDHQPVMRDEIVASFEPIPAGVLADATLGGGGHAEAILASRDDLSVLGIDRDPNALAAARDRLSPFGKRVMTYRGRFDELATAMAEFDVAVLSGALFDLGVSSPQLDMAERGFSYRHDGPLDMRMDPDSPRSAADLVNDLDVDALVDILQRHGDERFARRIARAVIAARPIERTTELARVITEAIPAAARRRGGHPAKRAFQAIRIAVNGELDAIPAAVDQAVDALARGGRIAVLAYHSGEDRLVKERLRAGISGGCICPPSLPCVCGAEATLRNVRAPKTPTDAEQTSNRRATSARLRVAEKI